MVSEVAFLGLLLLVAAQRALELKRSRRHETALRARGAIEHAREQMPWMIALHACWLVGSGLEVWVFARPFRPLVALCALAVFVIGEVLRASAIRALGPRWTVRILTLPGDPPVTHGPFRYLRHPNYLGVALEIFALPLVHSAYVCAVVFSVANAVLLTFRVRAEERALESASRYQQHFGDRPRFFPGA